MKIEHAIELLASQRITVTAEEIIAALSPMTIESIEAKDIDFVVEALKNNREQSTAIAPTSNQSSAIAPTTPKRKSGKLAKAKQREGAIAPHATTVTTRSIDSNAAALTTSQQVIANIGSGLVGQDQAALLQVAQLNAALIASAPQRLDAATQVLLAQMGIADPTDSILQQHADSCNGMVRSIAQAINESNVALGIGGMGFDVEIEE